MEHLQGKVAVITGATSGIGKALAEAFAEKGVRLVLHGRDEIKLVQIANKTSAAYVLGDITRPDVPGQLLDTALAKFGACHIVVNNAGVLETGTIEAVDIEKISVMVRVNVEAAFRVIYVFVKHFKSRGEGDVVNITSVVGTKVRETAGAYAGTKFAVEALSEALRMELAKTNVRVTCIEPGVVETGLDRRQKTPTAQALNISTPLRSEDIVDSVLYVLQQDRRIRIPRLMILPKDHVI